MTLSRRSLLKFLGLAPLAPAAAALPREESDAKPKRTAIDPEDLDLVATTADVAEVICFDVPRRLICKLTGSPRRLRFRMLDVYRAVQDLLDEDRYIDMDNPLQMRTNGSFNLVHGWDFSDLLKERLCFGGWMRFFPLGELGSSHVMDYRPEELWLSRDIIGPIGTTPSQAEFHFGFHSNQVRPVWIHRKSDVVRFDGEHVKNIGERGDEKRFGKAWPIAWMLTTSCMKSWGIE